MKIQHHIKSAIALLAFAAASQASADVISLDATVSPAYLNNTSYMGSFDGSAVLPASFTINSFGFSFLFADDSDNFTSTTGAVSSSSSIGAAVVVGARTETVTTTITNKSTVTRTGGQEGVTLSFGSVLFSGQTAPSSTSSTNKIAGTPVVTSVTYTRGNGSTCSKSDWQNNVMGCKQTTYYSVTNTEITTNETDYTGQIALSNSLLGYGSLLTELLTTKQLGFGINVTGDLNFVSAKLDIDYTKVMPAGNEVPEPGSLALFGIALLGAAGVRRARKQG